MRQPPLNVCVARSCMSGSKESPARMAAARASAPCASISSNRLYTWRRAGQLAPLRPWLSLQPSPHGLLVAAEPTLPRAVLKRRPARHSDRPAAAKLPARPVACDGTRRPPPLHTGGLLSQSGQRARSALPVHQQPLSAARRTSTSRAVASGAGAAPPAALPPAAAFPATAPALAAPDPAARPLVPAAAPVSARMSAGGALPPPAVAAR